MNSTFTKKHKIEVLRRLIGTNDKWAKRALIRIYDAQTEDEKANGETRHENGIGFNGTDAGILTKIAKWYREKDYIGEGYMLIVKSKMPKYAAQVFSLGDFNHEMFDRIVGSVEAVK